MTSAGKHGKKDQDIRIGKKYSMRSRVLGEERPYWVYLPASYDARDKRHRYPVLYLLDGDGHFHCSRCQEYVEDVTDTETGKEILRWL